MPCLSATFGISTAQSILGATISHQKKYKAKSTKQLLLNEKLINAKLRYEKGDFENNFDYLLKCSHYIKTYSKSFDFSNELN